jgi:DNA-binding response OmpR family regulator/DNA-binding CsgD family transcriptional regulator
MNEQTLVLVVDDAPDTLALLHDSLIESGYTVLVATNGASAIKICQDVNPDILLLDAVMPGMDGFEVCKNLKNDLNTRHIPVIFMTGLTEPEHIVAGFTAGAIDYVTKPLNPNEVIARLTTHLGNARQMTQTQSALDAFGQAAIALLPGTNKIIWQTPLSKQLLDNYFDKDELSGEYDLTALDSWVREINQADKQAVSYRHTNTRGYLVFTAANVQNDEQWVVLIREESEAGQIEALQAMFKLTKRQSEVLHWAIMGKTDKIIGQILGTSPRTVNKHMEHILIKLGVESRTAAAAKAMNKLHSLRGQTNN